VLENDDHSLILGKRNTFLDFDFGQFCLKCLHSISFSKASLYLQFDFVNTVCFCLQNVSHVCCIYKRTSFSKASNVSHICCVYKRDQLFKSSLFAIRFCKYVFVCKMFHTFVVFTKWTSYRWRSVVFVMFEFYSDTNVSKRFSFTNHYRFI